MEIEYFVNNMIIETKEDIAFANAILKEKNKQVKIGDYIEFNGGIQTKNDQSNLTKEPITSLTERVYIVKPLDTISTISKKLEIDEKLLKQILNGQRLFIGKKINY